MHLMHSYANNDNYISILQIHISISAFTTIKESHILWYDFLQLGRQTLRILDPLVQL